LQELVERARNVTLRQAHQDDALRAIRQAAGGGNARHAFNPLLAGGWKSGSPMPAAAGVESLLLWMKKGSRSQRALSEFRHPLRRRPDRRDWSAAPAYGVSKVEIREGGTDPGDSTRMAT
jgi:hypothetical protein